MAHRSWTTETDDGIRNVHERIVQGDLAASQALLATLGGPDDRVWPADRWEPMILDRGLEVGSDGGHGAIRYRVEAAEPGRSVRFASTSSVFDGWHGFTIDEVDGGVRWRHELEMRRPSRLLRALVVPLHDAVLEDLLDQVEAATAGAQLRRSPRWWSTRWRRAVTAPFEPKAVPAR